MTDAQGQNPRWVVRLTLMPDSDIEDACRADAGTYSWRTWRNYRPRLCPTADDTTDWTSGEYAILSFTIELRPDSIENGGFILPPDQIQPTFEENLPAALEFIMRTV
jgi:hypothetical protein